ncbi:carboxypeptidase-like regulatory domain-containing protein [Urechidicola vernalis]|uniref:Carboxypeptidase-like regulatory domain-containing protein n=1 Tax=Urechidicola vernalis TaxID=3075600 RepID=A0ABU2Y4K3_9FLAO|nr:carboxypeptidase-like regulatory domain-containing protein [Urechidicola sp. P050]MDT0552205.1 carboxypeptidase-like regulatory domain-containing protein [Urechidicola sp. P050]
MKQPTSFHRWTTIIAIALFSLLVNSPKLAANNFTNIQKSQQSFTEFKGTVIDINTKEKLVFADISINESNIRTVTNTEGAFLLKVPNNLLGGVITVSFLGYKDLLMPIESLNKGKNIISLEVSVNQLSAVNVSEPKDALELIKTALNNKNENYDSNQLLMTAFYRETIKKGRKNASLSEAVVDIYKIPYETNRDDRIQLIKSRKNTDYAKLDTIALKLRGGPYTTLHTDMVKYPEYVFNKDTYKFYDFSIESTTQINNRDVYVVKFKQKKGLTDPYYYGKLYIDMETTTFVSAVFSLNLTNKKMVSEMFVYKKPRKVDVTPTQANYRVDFKTKNGKWYYGYSNIQLGFKVNWRNKIFNSNYTLGIEMAVTDWKTDNSGKLESGKMLRPTTVLVDEASGFSDPEFWGEYNIIEPEKSIESAISKIAKQLKRGQ